MKDSSQIILSDLISRYDKLKQIENAVKNAVNLIVETTKNGGKVLVCGNGGSAADAEHISGELLKSFKLERKIKKDTLDALSARFTDGKEIADNLQEGVKCLPLTSFTAFNTAFNNDCDGKYSFAQAVNVLGDEKDVLIALSTSGNAENVCLASKVAIAKKLSVIALTGKDGGKLKSLATVLINADEEETFKVQELHLPIYHAICLMVENELFGK